MKSILFSISLLPVVACAMKVSDPAADVGRHGQHMAVDRAYTFEGSHTTFHRVNSSPLDNNCGLYSLVRENRELLQYLLAGGNNSWLVEEVLSAPEFGENPRRMALVRDAIIDHMISRIDELHDTVAIGRISVRQYLEHSFPGRNAVDYLRSFKTSGAMLDGEFFEAMSAIYGLSITIMQEFPLWMEMGFADANAFRVGLGFDCPPATKLRKVQQLGIFVRSPELAEIFGEIRIFHNGVHYEKLFTEDEYANIPVAFRNPVMPEYQVFGFGSQKEFDDYRVAQGLPVAPAKPKVVATKPKVVAHPVAPAQPKKAVPALAPRPKTAWEEFGLSKEDYDAQVAQMSAFRPQSKKAVPVTAPAPVPAPRPRHVWEDFGMSQDEYVARMLSLGIEA